jgi:hypothetical protein
VNGDGTIAVSAKKTNFQEIKDRNSMHVSGMMNFRDDWLESIKIVLLFFLCTSWNGQ